MNFSEKFDGVLVNVQVIGGEEHKTVSLKELLKAEEGNFNSISIIGANGSGKSRLGAYLYEELSKKSIYVRHISALRNISLDLGRITPMRLKKAEASYELGTANENSLSKSLPYRYETRKANLYRGKMTYGSVSDFEAAINYSMARMFAQLSDFNDQRNRGELTTLKNPEMAIDKIRKVFQEILKFRELKVHEGTLITADSSSGENASYSTDQMSDGERALLYFLFTVMEAKDGAIIIIDEPELHMHKSVQYKLWDILERERPDCLFVYITHDLEFAVNRSSSLCLWCEKYGHPNKWELKQVNPNLKLPQALLLELLGSREKILFVEGDENSYDAQLFKTLYHDFTVKPVGSCKNVIDYVKAFKKLKSQNMHNIESFGIVDRDYRSESRISGLEGLGVKVLPYAEIENIFLDEKLLRIMAKELACNVDDAVKRTKGSVYKLCEKIKMVQATQKTISAMKDSISQISELSKSNLLRAYDGIDLEELFSKNESELSKALEEKDYSGLLKRVNEKKLLSKVPDELGGGSYPQKVVTLVKGGHEEVSDRLKEILPKFDI